MADIPDGFESPLEHSVILPLNGNYAELIPPCSFFGLGRRSTEQLASASTLEIWGAPPIKLLV